MLCEYGGLYHWGPLGQDGGGQFAVCNYHTSIGANNGWWVFVPFNVGNGVLHTIFVACLWFSNTMVVGPGVTPGAYGVLGGVVGSILCRLRQCSYHLLRLRGNAYIIKSRVTRHHVIYPQVEWYVVT